jgi:hypothetical protein
MEEKTLLSPREERLALMEKLFSHGEHGFAQILEKCGQLMSLTCTVCLNRHLVETQCKKRWCPECAPRISAKRLSRLSYGTNKLQWPLFVTLTVQNTASAQGCFRNLRAAFGRFRRTKFWLHTVKGGMCSMEITNRGQGWHPHLHCLIDCKWLSTKTPQPQQGDPWWVIERKCESAQKDLTEAWAKCIKQETSIVWVKRTDTDAIIEVMKYACKPGDLIACDGNPGEVIRAMDRTRLISTFGTLYGLSKEWKEMEKQEKKGIQCEVCKETGTFVPSEMMDIMLSRSCR